MKKYTACLLIVLLVLSIMPGYAAMADSYQDKAGIPNPMEEVASVEDINNRVGCNIKSTYDVYYNVSNESFCIINGEYPIAQYKFDLDVIPVCIRAAVTAEDISGIFMKDGKHPVDFLTAEAPYEVIDTGYGMYSRWFIGGMQYSIQVGDGSDYSDTVVADYINLSDDVLMLRDYEAYYSAPWYEFGDLEMSEYADELAYREQIREWNETNAASFGTGTDKPYQTLKDSAGEADKNQVTVSTIDEFLNAIAPDTEICLAPGYYFLTDAADYGTGSGSYYHWEETYDGYELQIENADNLSIKGAFDETEDGNVLLSSAIITTPRYSEVIRFRRCNNATLSGVSFGHTEAGECCGGVLAFELCNDVKINACDIYGCGTVGIEGMNCQNMLVEDSIIHDCSYMHAELTSCRNIVFRKNSFLSNTNAYGGINIYGCSEIVFEDCDFANNVIAQLINEDGSDSVKVINCFIFNNSINGDLFTGDRKAFSVEGGAYVDYSMDDGQYRGLE